MLLLTVLRAIKIINMCPTEKVGDDLVVNRGDEKVRVHMNVVPRSTMNTNDGTEN